MPLLHAISIDHHGHSFTIALCFLDQEIEENYLIAIQFIRSLFNPGVWPSAIGTDRELALINAIEWCFPPIRTKHLLCYWHVSKCILTNCKSLFETIERWEEFLQAFNQVIFSKTEEQYSDILDEFKLNFNWNEGHLHVISPNSTPEEVEIIARRELERQALQYTFVQWLIPYKEKLVRAWTDRHFHRGNTTTSRLEGAHAILKNWTGKPSKDLARVWDSISLAIADQFNQIEGSNAQKYNSTPLSLSGQFFGQVLGKISQTGLYEVRRQLHI